MDIFQYHLNTTDTHDADKRIALFYTWQKFTISYLMKTFSNKYVDK